MQGFIGFILLLFGLINVTSDNAGVFGWLATLAGAALLITFLSGPYRKGNYGSGGGDGGSYSSTDSGCSGGDGGGGGGD